MGLAVKSRQESSRAKEVSKLNLLSNLQITSALCAALVAEGVVAVNQAIDEGDAQALVSALQTRSSGFCSVIPDCGEAYLNELKELKDGRNVQGTGKRDALQHARLYGF